MVQSRLPEIEFHIYGDGNIKSELVSLVQQLNLTGTVRFFDPISIREIADVMAEADLAVVPKRADSFGNEAYSTKIMEFMSLGVPVVVSSTKIDRLYFNDSVVKFFESGNPVALADAIYQVLRDSKYRHDLVLQATEYVALNGWSKCKEKYFNLVDSLCRRDHIVNNSL
jgi:glycosyltransferase involved in cell wall biosynthesis